MSGFELSANMMNGLPTRMKREANYVGTTIPPCGEFQETEQCRRTTPPWLKINGTTISRKPLRLHDEIKMFMEYMTPSAQEVAARKDLVKRFTLLIESLDSSVTVVPVGSYVTGLYLPTSDIDMVLKPRKAQTRPLEEYTLRSLYYRIRHSGFSSKTEDVLKASVPLIRITDMKTGIEIDLTASDTHSFKATSAVEKWLEHDADIARMLIFVVKVFLAVRRCGTTYTGGINSYVLVWMVVAWVKLEWPKLKETLRSNTHTADSDVSVELADALRNLSLLHVTQSHHETTFNTPSTVTEQATTRNTCPDFGEALKAFLKFYGYKFNYENHAISIEPTPRYILKTYPTVSILYIVQRYLLSIFDPASPSIDMGAKAYGINHIKASFRHAYRVLTQTDPGANARGLLGTMIGGDFTKFVQKRNNLNVGRSIAL